VDAGVVTNTAIATGTPGAGAPISDVDTATVTIAPAPAISLTKSANPSIVGSVGTVVTFTFVAVNTGNLTLMGVVVTDPMPGLSPIVCPGFGGTLAPGASVSCTATHVVTAADLLAGSIRNTATVAGFGVSAGVQVSSSGTVTVVVVAPPSIIPAITLVKTVSATTVQNGSTVTYTFRVTNSGNVTLTGVVVSDPLAGLGVISCPGFDGSLDPGEIVTCTARYVVHSSAASGGRITNTATAAGRAPAGTVVSSQGTAVLTVTGSTLPSTGSDIERLLSIASRLVLLGLLGLLARRRRTA
jgi:uncharacterized repeat protein (TIGR01451 family)/LPXTG-motif cell wall-anchored protein